MRTNDLPTLRPVLLTVALVLTACGGPAGDPGQIRNPPNAGPGIDPGPSFERSEGWSVRRRMRSPSGTDVVLEERLTSFTIAPPWPSRIRRVDSAGATPWDAPSGLFIEDAALHPSGAVTAVLVDTDFAVWLARLSPDLTLLDLARLSDPDIVHDPLPGTGGITPPTDVTANALPRDSVRTASDGEETVVVVLTPLESVLL